jgi:hypothetical protein
LKNHVFDGKNRKDDYIFWEMKIEDICKYKTEFEKNLEEYYLQACF